MNIFVPVQAILGSIVVSIPVCHTGDRGSIPRQGVCIFMVQYSSSRMLTLESL